MSKVSWRKGITEHMERHGETWADVEACTLSEKQLDEVFDPGFGGTEGEPFTVWTALRVYFPGCYDGAEWVDSVSRNPDGVATAHIGGG